MRLRAGRRGDDVAATNRDGRVAKPIFAFAGHNEEQLVHDVMPMEGERFLARRYDVHRTTQAIETDQRPDAAPFDRELLAIATVFSVISQTPFQTTRKALLRLARKFHRQLLHGYHSDLQVDTV